MDLFLKLALVVHVLVAIAIIVLVLLQHGKGADMGAAFGSGSSGSLFGATGSANFLSRATAILATVFFLTSLGLTWFATNRTTDTSGGIMGTVKEAKGDTVPGADAAPKTGDAPKAEAGTGKGSDVPK
jgi:preprotein translocase subunit SecG